MSEQVIEVLDYLGGKLGLVVDWSSDNLIPYMNELMERFINYKVSCCIVGIIVCAIFAILIPIGFILGLKQWQKNKHSDWDIFCMWYGTLGGIAELFLIGIGIIDNILTIIKCVNIPEMVIYEYIQQMIK